MSSPGSPPLTNFSNISAAHENVKEGSNGAEVAINDDVMDVDMISKEPLSLTSFVPIIQKIPGIILEGDTYHIDTLPSSVELQELISYCQSIEGLTLTDSLQNEYPKVSTATITRLAKLKVEWLPSLKHLRIDDADTAMDYIWFCTTPSLEALEVAHVPTSQNLPLSSFFKEIVCASSRLTSVILGPGRLPFSVIQTTLRFTHIRHLDIHDAAGVLDFTILQGVSALPELEQLIIDARTAEYTPCPQSKDDITDDNDTENALTHVSENPFPKLKDLTFVGNVVLMGDLIYRLFPCALDLVSLTLVRNGPIAIPTDWFKSQFKTSTDSSTNPAVGHDDEPLTSLVPSFDIGPIDPSLTQSHTFAKASRKYTCKGYQSDDSKGICSQCQNYKSRYLESERKRLAAQSTSNIISQTTHFARIIEAILEHGNPRTLNINRFDTEYFENKLTINESIQFPLATFRKLLSSPTLEKLVFERWALLSTNGDFLMDLPSVGGSPLPLKSLSLPLDGALNSGIRLSTLQSIAHRYPNLVEFQTLFSSSSAALIPDVADSTALSHGLRKLSVGGEFMSMEKKMEIATYLSFLFPCLERILTKDGLGYGAEGWQLIYKLVKMCQNVRVLTESIHRPV